jgi:transcriptional regulator with XRE-family HTH domain
VTTADLVRVLVARRVKLGWTQTELARRCGVTHPTVARFETECLRTRSPSLYVINRYGLLSAWNYTWRQCERM